MKEMKGRFLKKLSFIPTTITTLKQGLVFHHFNSPQNFSAQNHHILSVYKEQDSKNSNKDEEMEFEFRVSNQGNYNVASTLEPKLTAPDEDQISMEDYSMYKDCEESSDNPCLTGFEEKCPPEGEEAVVFYTTSLRGIRKTFEDCSTIRFLLNSFKVVVQERDVSMHMEFRDELWTILEGRVIPPRLFIKGRYIGGADEVVTLHEQGKLKKLLEGIPLALPNHRCSSCAGVLFVVCSNCSGSRKVYKDGGGEELCIRCPECNENGLVKCPVCC
ncbi:hypothetical protein SLEP1_g40609 [Rubroshorea leprosula]|uniref:Glutaredoxin domain-containing protein n=1 Tax=Rubroshorea leprosula TaxID=152421 RepID=A0AAV5L4T7_9ROSI|nr:hypothetical protein SLEP1_g40609 [Rubroshorea leprosula]